MLSIVYAANTLLYQAQGVIPFAAGPTPSSTPTPPSGGLTGCEGVQATKALGAGAQANATNLFYFWAPIIGVVLLVLAAIASLGNSGGKWWKRLAILIGVLLILPGAIHVLDNLGTHSKC